MIKKYSNSSVTITFKQGIRLNRDQLIELAELLDIQETTDKFSKGEIIDLYGNTAEFIFRVKNDDGDIVLWAVKE